MTLREFWQAVHAVLLYDRSLPVARHSTVREASESVRSQLRQFLNPDA